MHPLLFLLPTLICGVLLLVVCQQLRADLTNGIAFTPYALFAYGALILGSAVGAAVAITPALAWSLA